MTRTFNEGVNRFSIQEYPSSRKTYTLKFLEDLIPTIHSLIERGYQPVPGRSRSTTLYFQHPASKHGYMIATVVLDEDADEEEE